ncbi:MAG: type II secretion system F family protein [Patescibacteria group bacterium]|nr:type II secretion system F family protein [Patescibacteria group bacterium]
MQYVYRALKDGKTLTGKIEANSVDEAISALKSGGFFPIEVKKELSSSLGLSKIFDRVNYTDIVNFTRQMSIMLNAGITLVDCFAIFKQQAGKQAYLRMVETLDRDIRSGKTFSDALREFPDHFSPLYVSLVKAGEASGKLNEILFSLADNMEKQRELRGRVSGALIYPMLIVIGMFLVIFLMITFVIPKLVGLYKDMGVNLPWTTQVIVTLSDFSVRFWPLVLGAIGGLAFAGYNFYRSPQGKAFFDVFLLKVPVINTVLVQSMLVDTTRALSILVGSGVSILEALEIVREGNPNGQFKAAFKRVSEKVEKGISLGQALRDEPVFPPLIVQMAVVGEQTGHLDETMGKIAEYFNIESQIAIKNLTTMIEPTVLIVLGVSVGFLIFSVITPIYSLTNSIQ